MTLDNPSRSVTADNYFELAGRVAVVTGASSGLGHHFARVLSAAGCKVALLARRAERLHKLAQDIHAQDGTALVLPVDVCNHSEVVSAFETVQQELGPTDVLVNNAGTAVTARFLDRAGEDEDRVMQVNQHAVWRVAQVAARQMVDGGISGSIINIASIFGLRVGTATGAYSVSKAAVVQMTKVMALELARHNIRANAIAPGYFSTEMNEDMLAGHGQHITRQVPMRRVGQHEELDGLLLLLASQRSSFTTGAVIPVDGGHVNSSLT